MNELELKVLQNLAHLYAQKGIDIREILTNKEFLSLPLKSKVEAIKYYAETVKPGTTINPTKSDIKQLLAYAGVGGLVAVGATLPIGIQLVRSGGLKNIEPLLGRAAAIGGLAGLGAGVSNVASSLAARKAIEASLNKIRSTTDKNEKDHVAVSMLVSGSAPKYIPEVLRFSEGASGKVQGALSLWNMFRPI